MCSGSWFGENVSFIRSAANNKHPGQHDVQQEVSSAQQLWGETQQKSHPQTSGPQAKNQGTVSEFKAVACLHIAVLRSQNDSTWKR